MKYVAIKEIYEQVGESEYNRINPYQRMRGVIRHKHPNAKITKTETVIEPFGSVLVPVMAMYYEVTS